MPIIGGGHFGAHTLGSSGGGSGTSNGGAFELIAVSDGQSVYTMPVTIAIGKEANTRFTPLGSVGQEYGTDFTVSGNQLTILSTSIINAVKAGDKFQVEYDN